MIFYRRRKEFLIGDEGEKLATRHLVSCGFLKLFPLASAPKVKTLRAPMAWKRKVTGSVLGVIGFMLSPLSWWNDAVVNLPLAWLFASAVGLIYKPVAVPNSTAFDATVILGYWLTNILGFVLMHKGAHKILSAKEKKYSRRAFVRDVGVSLLYTGLIVVLIKAGVLKPLGEYLAK
jgi:hypothetical protein